MGISSHLMYMAEVPLTKDKLIRKKYGDLCNVHLIVMGNFISKQGPTKKWRNLCVCMLC